MHGPDIIPQGGRPVSGLHDVNLFPALSVASLQPASTILGRDGQEEVGLKLKSSSLKIRSLALREAPKQAQNGRVGPTRPC